MAREGGREGGWEGIERIIMVFVRLTLLFPVRPSLYPSFPPPGHLSYAQDPQALRSLLVRPFGSSSSSSSSNKGGRERGQLSASSSSSSPWELIAAFTEDPHLLAFARHFCSSSSSSSSSGVGKEGTESQVCSRGLSLLFVSASVLRVSFSSLSRSFSSSIISS